jgi:HlyD family secretion protein
VQANIVELPVKEGSLVGPGDLLVKLDQTRYEAEVRMAKANLASTQATMKQNEAAMLEAKLAYERADKLFEKGLMSEENKIAAKTAHDVATARYESSEYQVQQYEALVIQARDQLSKTVLTSPIQGVVTELNAEVGEIVLVGTMNNPGTVILTVADLSEIEVEAEVDETDIANVRLGQKASIKVDAFPDTTFDGYVTEVGNSAKVSGFSSQDQVTNFIVTVQFAETFEFVRPGMTAEVDITTNEHSDVLYVPIQAVVMREELPEDKPAEGEVDAGSSTAIAAETPEDDTASSEGDDKEYEGVFVIKDGQATFVQVETGIADQQNIEIVSGLQDSTEIVVGPYRLLRTLDHGEKVVIDKTLEEGSEEEE